jgi:hypothetical protein
MISELIASQSPKEAAQVAPVNGAATTRVAPLQRFMLRSKIFQTRENDAAQLLFVVVVFSSRA